MKIYFTLLVFFAALTLHAQDENATLSFIAYWQKGESKRYKITKTKRHYVADTLAKEEMDAYIARFTILDSTESSYAIEMIYEQELTNSTELTPEWQAALSGFEDLTILYATDELGTFQEVTNLAEIQALLHKVLDIAIEKLDTTEGMDLQKALAPIRAVFTSPEGIQAAFFKEIIYFHFPFGVEYDIEEPVIYEDELPNAFGGEPFKAIGSIAFESVNYDNYTCRFINTLRIDPESTRNLMLDIVGGIMQGITFKTEKDREQRLRELQEEYADMKFDINDYNEFEYEFDPGWPTRIHIKRTMNIESRLLKQLRTDELHIEVLKE